jgi:nucleotide-binding universal stress UspA family protein
MFHVRTILHATDFSEAAASALHVACSLAQAWGARLLVLHVAKHPVIAQVKVASAPGLESYEETASVQLRQLQAANPHVYLEPHLAFGAVPAREILHFAQQAGADLIVIGAHGQSGLRHLLMGSVAEQVMRRSPCPVLTVTHPPAPGLPGRDFAAAPESSEFVAVTR